MGEERVGAQIFCKAGTPGDTGGHTRGLRAEGEQLPFVCLKKHVMNTDLCHVSWGGPPSLVPTWHLPGSPASRYGKVCAGKGAVQGQAQAAVFP